MKPTKECRTCKEVKPETTEYFYWRNDTNNFRRNCILCERERSNKNNKERMFVNSKYVSASHPLHTAGVFETFQGAAFSSLKKYNSSPEGYVYIITNPSWKGWIKVGKAIDAEDRCKTYQTSSPFRDYKLCYSKFFQDRQKAETKVHSLLRKDAKDIKGEWFKINVNVAQQIIETL